MDMPYIVVIKTDGLETMVSEEMDKSEVGPWVRWNSGVLIDRGYKVTDVHYYERRGTLSNPK